MKILAADSPDRSVQILAVSRRVLLFNKKKRLSDALQEEGVSFHPDTITRG